MSGSFSSQSRRLAAALLGATLALGVFAPSALGDDFWSGLSTAGSKLFSGYDHHSIWVRARYTGGGNLPLGAGGRCVSGGCSVGSNAFSWYSGSYDPPQYNDVTACARDCVLNGSFLTAAWVSNQNPSTHTVHGTDHF